MGGECALLKVQASKTFEYCAREASQIFGGSSIVKEVFYFVLLYFVFLLFYFVCFILFVFPHFKNSFRAKEKLLNVSLDKSEVPFLFAFIFFFLFPSKKKKILFSIS